MKRNLNLITVICEMFEELGVASPSVRSLTSDWGIIGGETNAELQEWANDYASELDTEKAAEKQHGVTPFK